MRNGGREDELELVVRMFGMSGRELLFCHPLFYNIMLHSFASGQTDFGYFCHNREKLENFPPLGEEVTSETSTT